MRFLLDGGPSALCANALDRLCFRDKTLHEWARVIGGGNGDDNDGAVNDNASKKKRKTKKEVPVAPTAEQLMAHCKDHLETVGLKRTRSIDNAHQVCG